MVLEKSCESPLDSKEIKPVNPKGNQPWIFIGRTDAEADALILWPSDAKSWLIGKDPDAGKDWRWEEKGMTENEMDGITYSVDMNLSKVLEIVKDREGWVLSMGSQRGRHNWATEQQHVITECIIKASSFKYWKKLPSIPPFEFDIAIGD